MNNKLIILTFFLFLSRGIFGQALFNDDFEADLEQWEYQEPGIAQIIKTEDSNHESVLKLTPNRTAECVLIKDSDKWERIAIKGQALFTSDQHDYLGLVYNYHEANRIDFGCIYIKGKGSYIRVNPHRDGNASRALYEEYKTALTGNAEIKVNQWFSGFGFTARVSGFSTFMDNSQGALGFPENFRGRRVFRFSGNLEWFSGFTARSERGF